MVFASEQRITIGVPFVRQDRRAEKMNYGLIL